MKRMTDQQISDMLTGFTKQVEETMPAKGVYGPISNYINIPITPENEIVCRYGIRVYQMTADIQPDRSISYLEDYALSTDGYKSSMIIQMGKKDAILEFLRAEGLIDQLQTDFDRLYRLLTED